MMHQIFSSKMTQADQRRMRTVFRNVGFQKDGVFKDRALTRLDTSEKWGSNVIAFY